MSNYDLDLPGASTLSTASTLKPAKLATGEEPKTQAATTSTNEAIKVSLSTAGIQKAVRASNKDRDIDDSGLPADVQQVLKMLRKFQRQIADKTAQMRAVMANNHLTPQQVKAKLGMLEAEIAGLNAGLITANGSLSRALKQSNLAPDQIMKAASLAMVF